MKKLTRSQLYDRLIHLTAVALVPGIPLFYLYNRNAMWGYLFKHFLITGVVLAVISLAIYLPISKFILKYRRAMVIIVLFWAAFWFFTPIGRTIARGDAGLTAFYLLGFIVGIGLFLRRIKINRLVANTLAILLCLMFAFNFIPGMFAVSRSKIQMAYNQKADKLPYMLKKDFYVDPNLPKPNIYWLHMDAMVSFDAVERYFSDPQTTLKNDLTARGFVINKSARLEAGYTGLALMALTSPVFYDSFLAGEFARVAQLIGKHRADSISKSMEEKGVPYGLIDSDIYPNFEVFTAFSDAGYVNLSNSDTESSSKKVDMYIYNFYHPNFNATSINVSNNNRKAISAFSKLTEFKELITTASALSIIKPKIDKMFERKIPVLYTQPLPAYQETVDNYLTGSDTDGYMTYLVRVMKYATSIQTPHFVLIINAYAHCRLIDGTEIGGIDYEKYIGITFIIDENGNVYKERLDDPNDVYLYLPQHKFTVKLMMAQIDTIIENDPNAVIIIQGDHGIHGIGNDISNDFDSEFMFARGYSLEDQLNLNRSVISAVRIPPQYGKLSQPLDPLDITRYLVNNFVGKGNYDYLYYTEE